MAETNAVPSDKDGWRNFVRDEVVPFWGTCLKLSTLQQQPVVQIYKAHFIKITILLIIVDNPSRPACLYDRHLMKFFSPAKVMIKYFM